ncbi:conserved Plasmodium protein, unknown function [Plasmodium berghei]|uniref:Uncharacterized protein n=2 Tax=Plasmodium berghei TaxID=5821 RepID=A0A509ARJ4_PLABA|nr:conserved Plasmodium protein, unknown function [Plasmodium berghei ANKA]CXJ29389.1 conserved Plasmodium protein, unknown function [Plasmodium berghei]SCM27081.1 conserved Plasmodium protein, unknown function [Plasmodium berghei]SCN28807.1 conserved Plasmodium protein, unknown function [Plasmodium berghei]SCO63103.1 conserved Plasmodium protein, unknown function [Plasmodium berghei]SCO64554.1 conserved Plasmodium protein, unknown function [Plasmodium berghei]|eukprot:XP_034424453.1 conserved Plasmodium protein, unknown function [Plasmodium berghei ANKA]
MKKSKTEITPSKNNKCDNPVDSKDEKDSISKYPASSIPNELVDYVYFVNYRAVVVKTKHYYATQNSYILFGDVFKIYNLKGEIKKIHAFFPGDQNNLSDTLIMLKTTIIAVTTSKAEALRVADEIEMICKICHKKRKATKFSIEGFLRKVRCDTCRVKPKHFINKNNTNINNNTKQKNNNYKNEPNHDSIQSKKNCISCSTITENYSNGYNNTNSRLNLNTNKNMATPNSENRHNVNSNNIQDKINITNYINDGNTITINNTINKEHGCQYNTKFNSNNNNNNNSIVKNFCYNNNIESYNGSALLCDNNINTNDSVSNNVAGSNKSINNSNDYKNKDEIVNMIVELIKYISWMQKALIKAAKGNYSIDNSEINIDKISQIVYSAQLLCNKLLRQKSLLEISNNNNAATISSILPFYNNQNNNITMETTSNSVNKSGTATPSNTATASTATGNDVNIKPKYSNLYAQKINTINKQNEINSANANSSSIFTNFINQNNITTSNNTNGINRNTRTCILNSHGNNNNNIEGNDNSSGNNNTSSNNGNTNCSENSNTSTNDSNNNNINETNDKKSRSNKSINNKIINEIETTDNINNSINANNHTDINNNINSMNNINTNLDIENINTYNNINCNVIPYHANNCQINCLTSLQSDRNYTRLSPFIKNENNYVCLNNKNNNFSNLVASKTNYYNDKQDIVFSTLSKQYNSNISFSNINNTVSNFYKAVAKNYNIGDTILNFEK